MVREWGKIVGNISRARVVYQVMRYRIFATIPLIALMTLSAFPAQEIKSPVTIAIPSKGLVLFDAKTNDKATGTYVLDNGNIYGTIVSADFIRQLGLDPKEKKHKLNLDIGGTTVVIDAKIGDAPNNWMSNTLKRKYQCLVGYDFFEKYLVTIDYPAAKLTVASYPADPEETKKNIKAAATLEFDYVEHAALVKSVIHKSKEEKLETNFFVDCGMTGNSISKEHYAKLQTPQKNGLTSAPLFTIGETAWKNVPFYVLDVPAVQETAKAAKKDVAGLLGRPFLERYRVTLDYKGKRIFLEK